MDKKIAGVCSVKNQWGRSPVSDGGSSRRIRGALLDKEKKLSFCSNESPREF